MEGWFNYINTFDLTVDHAFYDILMHPWALRNVLDAFSGALPGTGYTYETPLYDPSGAQVSSHGFSFHHFSRRARAFSRTTRASSAAPAAWSVAPRSR